MMKKVFLVLLITTGLFSQIPAKKKCLLSSRKKQTIEIKSSVYSDKMSGIGFLGSIYSFEIKTNKPNLIIDSVWFGATPVPCDLYKDPGGFRIKQTDEEGTYYIKANKSLYSIRNTPFDSTEAYKLFKPSVPFKGVAMIMYFQSGKRVYQVVDTVLRVAAPIRQ